MAGLTQLDSGEGHGGGTGTAGPKGSEDPVAYLARTAMEFVGLAPEADIYRHISTRLQGLLGDAFVGVASYDSRSHEICQRAVSGSSELLTRASEIAGMRLADCRQRVTPEAEAQMQLGRLIRIEGGIHGMLMGQVPLVLTRTIELLAGIQAVYGMGCVAAGECFGSVVFALRWGTPLPPVDIVETFVNQAAVALQRRRAEDALRVSEARYRTLFREMLNGFAVHEVLCDVLGRVVDYRYLEVNPAFERMTGRKAAELVGRPALEVLPGLARSWIETCGQVALTGRPASFEGYVEDLGRSFEVVAFRPGPGQFACIVSDITERRRVEAEREELQSQLLQAQKMESVGRLAGGVAHDFNNLLHGIMANVDMGRDELDAEHPARPHLDEIAHDARRSAALVRQLLAFARRQTVAPKVLDVNDALSATLKMLQRLLGEDIELAWRPGHGVGTVLIDPSQLDQVLANLAVNARDAIGGVGRLTIETRHVALDRAFCALHAGCEPGAYVLLTVSDTGCGMDSATLEHVFEPFFTTKAVGEGTGLGLATVYGIVKQNNGAIETQSEPGVGTTFRIYLPRHAAAGPLEQAASTAGSLVGGCETILLVEDEKAIRVTAHRMLERLGYTVLAAATPAEALQRAGECRGEIHLLLTDVVMPGMNGRDLKVQLTALRPGLKCLFMSGHTADVIAHRGVLEEGLDFMAKPFSRDDLARRVREVLGAAPGPGEGR